MNRPALLLPAAALIAAMPLPQITAPVQAQASGKVCMARTTTGRPGGDKEITIIVNSSKQGLMAQRGFKQAACKGNASHHAEYTREICKFASIAPGDVQAQFKSQHGASPSELCEASQ